MACSKSVSQPSPQQPVDPVMVVSLNGQFVKMRVRPGPEGMEQFRQQVRELFGIPPGVDFECSFRCKAPSGDTIQLEGLASYEAATHCASLLAAQRLARRSTHSTSTGSGSSHHSSSSGYTDLHSHSHSYSLSAPMPSAAGAL